MKILSFIAVLTCFICLSSCQSRKSTDEDMLKVWENKFLTETDPAKKAAASAQADRYRRKIAEKKKQPKGN